MARLPRVGDKVGRFAIKQLLGKGGMGAVYLAQDTMLDAQVALKFLTASMEDADAFARFGREVLLARRVTHPGICRIFDIHEEGDHRFITMEHIEGPTLYTLIRERGQLPPQEAAHIIRAMCNALTAAHARGVVHRDLKPSNVIVRARDRVSILDFGLSTALDMESITAAGVRVGTFYYISPERARGDPSSPLCDIYSLGVILYEALTGRLPYEGKRLDEVMKAIDAGNPLPPSHYCADVPPALDKLVLRAMATERDQRFASTREMKEELDRYLAGHSGWDASLDSSQQGPWSGDIDKSVELALSDPMASAVIRSHMRDTTILFSDIVGITPYFDARGDIAGIRKIQRHNDLLFPVVQANQGRVIKTIGDAIMACFEQAEQGVQAAVEMQQVLAAHNAAIDDELEQIRIRIGLHSGASIFDNDDVFGDTVNLAARISAKSEGDQILVSHSTKAMLTESAHRIQGSGLTELKGKEGEYALYSVSWQVLADPGTLEEPAPMELEDAGTVEEPVPSQPLARAAEELVDAGIIRTAAPEEPDDGGRPVESAIIEPEAEAGALDSAVDALAAAGVIRTPTREQPRAVAAGSAPPAPVDDHVEPETPRPRNRLLIAAGAAAVLLLVGLYLWWPENEDPVQATPRPGGDPTAPASPDPTPAVVDAAGAATVSR